MNRYAAFLGLLPLLLFPACGGDKEPAKSPESSSGDSSVAPEALEPRDVSFAMRGSENDYRKCFMRAIGRRGAVELEFQIDLRGQVEDAEVTRSSIGSPAVDDCLRQRLTQQGFGERRSRARGKWTFVFGLTDPITEEEREKLLAAAEKDERSAIEVLPESQGTIDAGHLNEVVQVNYPLFAHCYRDSIKRRGESRGLLRFRLNIDTNGRLKALDDAGSVLPDPYAVDCVAEGFYAMQFPKPDGGDVFLRYGLDFD